MKEFISLWIEKPGEVSLRQERIGDPSEGEILVRGLFSALSHGTEKLIYLGQLEENFPLDLSIPSLGGQLSFPIKYGYSNAGVIEAVGKGVDENLIGKKVFFFSTSPKLFPLAIRRGLSSRPPSRSRSRLSLPLCRDGIQPSPRQYSPHR
jgi:NADPH:quinone reductase-like Zn-dependent oxidoreductase